VHLLHTIHHEDANMGNEIWVAIALIFFPSITIITSMSLRHRQRIKELDTLVKLAEGGQDVKLDMLTLLPQIGSPPVVDKSRTDKRRGLIFIAVGIPLSLSLLIGGNYMETILFGGTAILIGVALLIMAKQDAPRAPD
jgi:hypothetical protein